MLGVWVLAGLEARDWGFNVAFLGFVRVSFFFFFWCSFCLLLVYLGAPLRFFNAILFITNTKYIYIFSC
jgi:hypothetical protein